MDRTLHADVTDDDRETYQRTVVSWISSRVYESSAVSAVLAR